VDDRDIEEVILSKPRHKACENRVYAHVDIPQSEGVIDARAVNFRTTVAIFFDQQIYSRRSYGTQLR
jgi:hypothetical protein